MSTTASTYHGPEITVEAIKRAMVEVERALSFPPPPHELRLHPDDLRELRLRAGEHVFGWNGTLLATSNTLIGLPVVEDIDAPRLPRKKRE